MHKIFIIYHHHNDQYYKDKLLEYNKQFRLFIDGSVDTGAVDDDLSGERIRELIRDKYLRDTTVTILLVGTQTAKRKHVDWEIYSSMYDGPINKKSGIIVIELPTVKSGYCHIAHQNEKGFIYPDITNWVSVTSWNEYKRRHPHLPNRIIDNLMNELAKISVASWDRIENNPTNLRLLIENAFNSRDSCTYDFSRPMRRKNS